MIGNDSCNTTDGCEGLSGSVGNGSCLGAGACLSAGANGSFSIADDSCNGETACGGGGADLGSFSAGAGSCNLSSACSRAGEAGSFSDGNDSCNGDSACLRAGEDGSFSAGDDSCEGQNACTRAGRIGLFSAGAGSCNGSNACDRAGEGGVFSVGQSSCNTAGNYEGCQADYGTVGDCENNDVEPKECIAETVQVRKYVFPSYDNGRFDLLIDGSPEATDVGHNGSTEQVEVTPGPVTVAEQGAGGTNLGNYRTTIICQDRDTGAFVDYGFSASLTVVVPEYSRVVCTIVNQRIFSWFWWW